MKYLLLLIAFTCTVLAQEQTIKGNKSLGGKISYTDFSANGSSYSILEISPQFSSFVSDGIELGGSLSLNSQSYDRYTYTTTGIGPFVNFYLTQNTVQPMLGFGYTLFLSSSGGSSNSTNLIALQGGCSIPLNAKVALQPLVQYRSYFGDVGANHQIAVAMSLKAFL